MPLHGTKEPMNVASSGSRLVGALATVTLAALSIGGAGCTEASASAAPNAQPERTEVARGAKAESDAYVAELKISGAYKAGAEGIVELTLAPKGAYHVNDKYPIKWKAAETPSEGLTFPKPLMRREDGDVSDKGALFKVPFVAAKAGKAIVAGTFSFSVCSDANCLMEKVELEVEVEAK
jgi:hypothetical protein